MNATMKKKGLGRGLEALLGGSSDITEAVRSEGLPSVLRLDSMQAGKYQPRTRMDEGALQELAASIRAQGVMQPILVRRHRGGGALRNHRRRAPFSRRAAGRPRRSAGAGARTCQTRLPPRWR